METSQISNSQTRASSGSTRPGGSRTTNPDKQISQIEKSVTHLLVATKQLLETLTQWSRGNAQEEEVSDVYVRLGYEFNLACRAFNSIGVETSDLGPVPDLLRSILEDTLSQPASPQALDNYLPRIRDIIINLLHGLKRKQSKLRSRPAKDSVNKTQGAPPRQSSVASVQSNESNLAAALENTSAPPTGRSDSRLDTLRFSEEPQPPAGDVPQTTSLNRNSFNRPSHRSQQSRQLQTPEATAPTSGPSIQNVPTISAPSPGPERSQPPAEIAFPYAPPPPPKQDALTALQRGPDLERRASRRFSAYQISKHLGASPNGVPVIPPAQNSPIPNRGREARESLTAVRSRTSFHTKKSASRLQEISPNRSDSSKAHNRISEERDEPPTIPSEVSDRQLAAANGPSDSPTIKTPEEYISSASQPVLTATVSGPMSPLNDFQPPSTIGAIIQPDQPMDDPVVVSGPGNKPSVDTQSDMRATATPSPTIGGSFESSPQGKELTLFLQYKTKIKKFVLPEGFEGLTMARLQLAFIEKFAWHTHNNGVELPEIYIQDPVSGVRHELEDLADVKDRCVMVLNVEVLDEVKKHFDESIGGLRNTLEGVRALLDGQGSMMQRVSDRQLQTSKDMARLSTVGVPPPRPNRVPSMEEVPRGASTSSDSSRIELQNLRRDIAVLRQTYSTMSSDFSATMSDIKAKAAIVKEAAMTAVAPSYEGDAGRAHVNQGKKTLSTDSEALVNRVDDLTDIVEDLRKDVVTRGVRPLPRQLEDVSKDIVTTTRQLSKMKEFLKREKPIWTKIWENELNQVCTERDDLTQQEELMSDLDGDLQDLTGVFKLVEEAMKQQSLQTPGPAGARNASKQFDVDLSVDPQAAKDGMLDEVRALKPNHESRLEAIERAEKARLRELEIRKEGEFQREVKEFVEEGKLKKTGGMEEVERLRKVRDERAMKENWERQAAREAEQEKKRQAEAAAKAVAEAAEAAKANEPQQQQQQQQQQQEEREEQQDLTQSVNGTTPAATGDELHLRAADVEPRQSEIAPAQHVYGAITVASQEAPANGRSSPPQSIQVSDDEKYKRYGSGPPQLPQVNFDGLEGGHHEEVRSTDPELSKTSARDSNWWKPALF